MNNGIDPCTALGAGWQAAWFRPAGLRFEGDLAAAPPGTFAFTDWGALLAHLRTA